MHSKAHQPAISPVSETLIFRALSMLSGELGEPISSLEALHEYLPTLAMLAGVCEADRSSAIEAIGPTQTALLLAIICEKQLRDSTTLIKPAAYFQACQRSALASQFDFTKQFQRLADTSPKRSKRRVYGILKTTSKNTKSSMSADIGPEQMQERLKAHGLHFVWLEGVTDWKVFKATALLNLATDETIKPDVLDKALHSATFKNCGKFSAQNSILILRLLTREAEIMAEPSQIFEPNNCFKSLVSWYLGNPSVALEQIFGKPYQPITSNIHRKET